MSTPAFQPHPAFPPEVAHRAPPAGHWPPAWAVAWGDDRFGLWAELEVGRVVQRFRWIEPGSFLMGSPETEPERENNEGPQHHVTLTHGFWLADTVCSQALWLAVMGGKNPSRFKGDELPVERVSWGDVVKQFLPKLQVLLLKEDIEATLPSEAQWEYSCRAGTQTPFSFGKQVNPEQVNYDGNYPYFGGRRGHHRERTVAVKALPPNNWGLFQMHGNVWEWCSDVIKNYNNSGMVNPQGISSEGAYVAGQLH